MRRNFSVRAIETCDLLTLSMDDLEKMMFEFPDVYYQLIADACETLVKHENLKTEEVQKREMERAKQKSELHSNISSLFMSSIIKTSMTPLVPDGTPMIQEQSNMRTSGLKRMMKNVQTGNRFKNNNLNFTNA